MSDAPEDPTRPAAALVEEIDVDRGPFVGAMIGVSMFVLFQGMILGLFQSGVVGGDIGLWAPLRFAGITQAIYVAPTLLFFVNRKCPGMAAGFAPVAGVVLLGTIVALVL